MCLKNKLSIDDFEFDSNGTTTLKLQVLPTSMKIQKTARMIGNYNHTKVKLYTEKIVGNIYAGIGFVKENGYYVPNTLLKDDSRNLLSQSNQIIAVFSKKRDQQLYDTVVYCGKINDLKAILPQIIINKIYIETLFPSDSIEGTKLTIS